MLGDLLEYPFDPVAWGAFWTGVTAVFTSASFVAAAIYYIRDSEKAKSAQARRIRFVADQGDTPDNGTRARLVVHNYSADSIYNVRCFWARRPIKEILLSPYRVPFFEDDLDEVYERWSHLAKWMESVARPYKDFVRIEAAGNISFDVDDDDYYDYWVEFSDAVGRWWKLGLNSSDPEVVKRRDGLQYTWRVGLRFPISTRGTRKEQREIKRWLREREHRTDRRSY